MRQSVKSCKCFHLIRCLLQLFHSNLLLRSFQSLLCHSKFYCISIDGTLYFGSVLPFCSLFGNGTYHFIGMKILVLFVVSYCTVSAYTTVLSTILLRNEFHYASSAFEWEVAMAVFMTIIDITRQELGTQGNKTGQGVPLLWSCGLTVPVILGYCFYLRLQSYV